MKPSTKVMPLAAAVTALSTLACCLPLSLTATAVETSSNLLESNHGPVAQTDRAAVS